jgi:hypothetical protein
MKRPWFLRGIRIYGSLLRARGFFITLPLLGQWVSAWARVGIVVAMVGLLLVGLAGCRATRASPDALADRVSGTGAAGQGCRAPSCDPSSAVVNSPPLGGVV